MIFIWKQIQTYLSRSKGLLSVLEIFHLCVWFTMTIILRVSMKPNVIKTVYVHSVELFSIYHLHTYITSCCNPFKLSIK